MIKRRAKDKGTLKIIKRTKLVSLIQMKMALILDTRKPVYCIKT
jgi:hypothetical protein